MSLVQNATIIKTNENVNEPNAHFSNPGFSSKVGAVAGYGASGSVPSLQQKGLYKVVKTGGKKMRKYRRTRKHKGGSGYGFSKEQGLASTSGVNSSGSVHLASVSSYSNAGTKSDTNMDASKQHGGRKRKAKTVTKHKKFKKHYMWNTKGKRYLAKTYKQHIRGARLGHTHSKPKKSKKHGNSKKHGKSKKLQRKHKQRGGYSQYMSNVANSHIYSAGAPPSLSSNESALANPVPFTPKNDCMNTWKHLGDMPPYNKVYN